MIWPPLIIAAAWLIPVAGGDPAGAPTSTTPYLVLLGLVAAVLVYRVGDDHPRGGAGGVFFPAHPGLAVSRRRPDRPYCHTSGAGCRGWRPRLPAGRGWR